MTVHATILIRDLEPYNHSLFSISLESVGSRLYFTGLVQAKAVRNYSSTVPIRSETAITI